MVSLSLLRVAFSGPLVAENAFSQSPQTVSSNPARRGERPGGGSIAGLFSGARVSFGGLRIPRPHGPGGGFGDAGGGLAQSGQFAATEPVDPDRAAAQGATLVSGTERAVPCFRFQSRGGRISLSGRGLSRDLPARGGADVGGGPPPFGPNWRAMSGTTPVSAKSSCRWRCICCGKGC